MGNIDIITLVIIGANVLFSMKGFKDSNFFNKYKFQISPIQQGEKIRMLSSGFLHVNSIYGMKKSIGNIGHSAHLGGAIGGYVLTLLLKPSVFETNKMLVIALAIPIVLLYFFRDKLR